MKKCKCCEKQIEDKEYLCQECQNDAQGDADNEEQAQADEAEQYQQAEANYQEYMLREEDK